jgi:hypothetical protein
MQFHVPSVEQGPLRAPDVVPPLPLVDGVDVAAGSVGGMVVVEDGVDVGAGTGCTVFSGAVAVAVVVVRVLGAPVVEPPADATEEPPEAPLGESVPVGVGAGMTPVAVGPAPPVQAAWPDG